MKKAAVEEIEHLSDHEGGHRKGSRKLEGHPPLQLPEEEPQGGPAEEEGDEEDPFEKAPPQDGGLWIPRRAFHDPRLRRLEGEGQGEGDIRDDIYPEDLHRCQGQGEAEDDGGQDDEGLRPVARQEKEDGLLKVVVDGPPLPDGGGDGGEVVVGEDYVRRLLGGLSPLDPHGDSHVRPLEGGGVVHPVPRHGYDLSVVLKGLHEAELVFGARPGEDGILLRQPPELLLPRGLELLSRNGLTADPHLLRYGEGRACMVAGDHLDLYPRPAADLDGLHRLGAGRVDDPPKAEKEEPLSQVLRRDLLLPAGRIKGGCREDPQPPAAHLFDLLLPEGAVEGFGGALGRELEGASVEKPVRRSLEKDLPLPPGGFVQGGHVLPLRFEGDCPETGVFPMAEPRLSAQSPEGPLGGFSGELPAAVLLRDGSVVGHRHDLDEKSQVLRLFEGDLLSSEGDLPLGGVPRAPDFVDTLRGRDVADGHLVLRQGARLVGADHRDGAQGLNRIELPGDGLLTGHPLNSQGEGDGKDGRKALGNGRHGETDGGKKELAEGEVVKKTADEEHEGSEPDNDEGEVFAEAVHLPDEGGFDGLDLVHEGADLAYLRSGPGGGDHARSPPGGHEGAREGHGDPVSHPCLGRNGRGVFIHGKGFPRQRGLLDAEGVGLEKAEVGGDPVARPQTDYVSGDEFSCVLLYPLAVPEDVR